MSKPEYFCLPFLSNTHDVLISSFNISAAPAHCLSQLSFRFLLNGKTIEGWENIHVSSGYAGSNVQLAEPLHVPKGVELGICFKNNGTEKVDIDIKCNALLINTEAPKTSIQKILGNKTGKEG